MKKEFHIKNENICKLTGNICNKNIICKYCDIAIRYYNKKKYINLFD